MYRVLKKFTDLQDKNYLYNVGDEYPRAGLTVTAERIAELSGKANRQGRPLIEEVQDKVKKAEPETAEAEKAEPVEDAPKKRGRKADK